MARGRKGQQEINASSMADIAFLLLIFFLVTTTIAQEEGILHRLPEWTEEPPPEIKLRERNVLEILVNSRDQIQVRGNLTSIEELRELAKKHINNFGRLENYSVSPNDAIISLKNDRGTTYGIYIKIQNELKAAYRELRDDEAAILSNGSYTYAEIDDCASDEPSVFVTVNQKNECIAWKQQIKDKYPIIISEAEPVNLGGNN